MINDLQLLLGDSYTINEHICIHNRTLGEILDHGEERYYRTVCSLICEPLDFRAYLYGLGIDYEKVSELEFFSIACQTLRQEDTRIILGNLNLSKFHPAISTETKEIVLYDSESDIIIDRKTHALMVDCIRKIHGIKKLEREPISEDTKAYILDKERYESELRRCKPYEPWLLPLVSDIGNYRDIRISTLSLFSDALSHSEDLKA